MATTTISPAFQIVTPKEVRKNYISVRDSDFTWGRKSGIITLVRKYLSNRSRACPRAISGRKRLG
jgi:hypothetical protein